MFHHPNKSNSLDALISQIDLNELTQETISQFCVIKELPYQIIPMSQQCEI